jgi:myosin heavy subunit
MAEGMSPSDVAGATNAEVPKEKKKAGSKKLNWVFTHDVSRPRITAAMLEEYGGIVADECHSTTDRATTYTYIHLKKPVRESTISKFFRKIKDSLQISPQTIFGYDMVGSTSYDSVSSVHEHIVIRQLVGHMNAGNSNFKPWTDGKQEVTRGLLYKMRIVNVDNVDKPETLVKSQLLEHVKRLGKALVETKERMQSVVDLSITLRRTNTGLGAENAELVASNDVLEKKAADLAKDVERVSAEKDKLGEQVEVLMAKLEERRREISELESATSEVERMQKELDVVSVLLLQKDDEMKKKDSELTSAQTEISAVRKELLENTEKALAHDSVVAENKAIMAHAVTLDGKFRALETKAKAGGAAKSADPAILKRLRDELDAERIRSSTLADSVSWDKRQMAEQVSSLRLRVQTLEADCREAKRQRALLEGELELARV